MNRLILYGFLLSGFLLSCLPNKEGIAPDVNFYYTINSPSSNLEAQIHTRYLSDRIPTHKYAITNASGYAWPFYQKYEIEEPVVLDSLMPPHWFIHKMIPLDPHKKIEVDEYFVAIDLYPTPDTLPNYNVTIYKMDDDSLRLSATTGIHYIQPTEYNDEQALAKLLLESTIRYSFK